MAHKYFSGLNYSLGNEDTGMEVEMCSKLRPKRILSIAGCGSRFLPLLACAPEEIVAIDLATQQLAISELRLETIRTFSHVEFLKFWGFPPYSEYDYSRERKQLFYELELNNKTHEYFKYLFEKLKWKSILYEGKWEKTFIILSKIVKSIMGKDYDKMFNFHSIDEQAKFYHNRFSQIKWKSIIFLLGNKSVFNALLYKGHFIKKNTTETHFQYYRNSFESLFVNQLARESFFANLCFFGKINHQDGNTIEANEENFMNCKLALNESGSSVTLEKKDLFSVAEDYKDQPFDFLSLSDVPSYFEGEIEKDFLQKLRPSITLNGVVVLRYYLRVADANEEGFEDITSEFSEEIKREKVQMYKVRVLRKTS